MKISTKAARAIRAGIRDARIKGWRRPPEMVNTAGSSGYSPGYAQPLYGRAWEHEMRRLGKYPPQPPKGPSGISRARS